MCGRTSLFVPLQDLEARFDASYVAERDYTPRFNIAPGENLAVIPAQDTAEIHSYEWGLIPSWTDEPNDAGWINARSETAHEKPAFRSAWADRPCLVLSSGFYEWESHNGGPKTPYRICREDDIFAMAGLWAEWEGENGGARRTVTILTTDANDLVSDIHDRMPVILPREREADWLDADPEARRDMCGPYPDSDLSAYEISTAVNDPSNDRPSIIEPAEKTQSSLGEFAG